MEIFDPYRDRLSRDIRNSLSSALVKQLTGGGAGVLSDVAEDWLLNAPSSRYQAYIEGRMADYRQVMDEINSGQVDDLRHQAICLWNLGLFFEMHELLETIWQTSREPERSALKGWIQAAGVCVHYQRGKVDAARLLAKERECIYGTAAAAWALFPISTNLSRLWQTPQMLHQSLYLFLGLNPRNARVQGTGAAIRNSVIGVGLASPAKI